MIQSPQRNLLLLFDTLSSSEWRGPSRVEAIAAKVEYRRKNRIKIPRYIHDHFLNTCQTIARNHGYENRFPVDDFERLHASVRDRVEHKRTHRREHPSLWHCATIEFIKQEVFGIWDIDETMLQLLDRGQRRIEACRADWFWYRDFTFFQIVR